MLAARQDSVTLLSSLPSILGNLQEVVELTARKYYIPWTPERYDEAQFDGKYMRVYRPDFPGSQLRVRDNMVRRAHVVWWLETGEVLDSRQFELHHISEDKTDDRFENLEKRPYDEHRTYHNSVERIELTCENCGDIFSLTPGQLANRRKNAPKNGGRFCSHRCAVS